ncbi:hemolysin family protein [Paractinoplanes ferrugineus]|uniref:Membrane protein n=1 Tax=Paractinoplanes ferrugineus TaxID=113564 RepID=A0A919IW55_9ACTN|nr:hemolysin family protein [Actinoplanes ferrugineus]GIE09233.1 membrane protein [Actinoplanes ferrugineus]
MTAVLAVLLLVGNAFFVAAEFALVASKRHRLEQAAATGGRAAAAALAGSRSLPLMLAGAQLGITLCSLGLGALAEPALAHWLTPLFHGVGLPELASHVIAFVIALAVVTFLHLVIGEMMPKSWAITDPEHSAVLLALPFRLFARLVGPLLRLLNALANAVLKPFGVRAQDQLPVSHGPAEMQILLDRSRAEGLIGAEQSELLSSVLGLGSLRVREVAFAADQLVTVPATASAADVELASMGSGRSRLAVTGADGAVVGFVHVRDVVRATTAGRDVTAADLMDEPFTLGADDRVVDAVTAMRAGRAQVALVAGGGFVALEDLLEQVLGPFDDETDPVSVAVPR